MIMGKWNADGTGQIFPWPMTTPTISGIRIPSSGLSASLTASPSGKLAYLERLSASDSLRYYVRYADLEKKVDANARSRHPYDPNFQTHILHVLAANGEFVTSRTIEQCYASFFDTIRFRGERFISLQTFGRLWGLYDETIIDLDSERKYMLSRAVHGEWTHSLSPEGHRMATVIADTHTTGSMILVNGVQVYPVYDEQPALCSQSPKDFSAARQRITEWLGQRKVAPLSVSQLGLADSNWSADGQRLAFLVQRHEAIGAEGKHSATFDLLVINVAAIELNRGSENYISLVPTDIAFQLASDDKEDFKVSWDSQLPEIVIQRESQPSFSRRYAAPVP